MPIGGIINLCFHGVGDIGTEREPGEAQYWISVEFFYRVLDACVGKDQIRLSFDDGNRSDLDIGLPALQERDLTATFFPLAGRLADERSLSAADLRTLRGSAMSIGTHGMDHVPWRRLDDRTCRREFVEARHLLVEASDGPINEAALPLGRYDRSALATLRDLGYTRVYSSDRMPTRSQTWFQPRYSVRASDEVADVIEMLSGRWSTESLVAYAKSRVKRLR